MKSSRIFTFLLIIFFITASIEIFLFLTGSKLLKNEILISPGEPYPEQEIVKIFGEYHAKESKSLICEYFNGRKIIYREFNYSATNKKGLDTCPTYLRPRQ